MVIIMLLFLFFAAATATRETWTKMVLVGDQKVGKSAIIKRLVGNPFKEWYRPTIGVDFKNIPGFQIWDTAGQDRFKSLRQNFIRGAHVAIIVYDITNRDSFSRVDEFNDLIMQHIPGDKND
eukprot:204927_1